MAHLFRTPQYSFIGADALADAATVFPRLGKKALIVTGQSMIRQGHVATLEALLDREGVGHARFSEIAGEPTDTMIDAGLAVYQQEKCDFAIGFGGGSALDAAKAIAVCAQTGEKITAFRGRAIDGPVAPVVCIPSTAGTGSEATKFTVITDTAADEKLLIGGDGLMPTLAIVDPQFSLEVPQSVTVATGMDALAHAIEAYASRKAYADSDLFCLAAVKRIFANLPRSSMLPTAFLTPCCLRKRWPTLPTAPSVVLHRLVVPSAWQQTPTSTRWQRKNSWLLSMRSVRHARCRPSRNMASIATRFLRVWTRWPPMPSPAAVRRTRERRSTKMISCGFTKASGIDDEAFEISSLFSVGLSACRPAIFYVNI